MGLVVGECGNLNERKGKIKWKIINKEKKFHFFKLIHFSPYMCQNEVVPHMNLTNDFCGLLTIENKLNNIYKVED